MSSFAETSLFETKAQADTRTTPRRTVAVVYRANMVAITEIEGTA